VTLQRLCSDFAAALNIEKHSAVRFFCIEKLEKKRKVQKNLCCFDPKMWSDFTGLVDNFIVIISLEKGLIYSRRNEWMGVVIKF
jgi:hypothetical protein